MPLPPLSDEAARAAAEALQAHNGNQTEAAESIGVKRTTFQHHIKIAARRGMLGPIEALPGYEIAKTSTTLDASGAVVRQSVIQRPEAGGLFEPPAGHRIKGVSTLLDASGNTIQTWVKTREGELDPDALAERLIAAFRDLPPAEPVHPPDVHDADLLTVYPIADAHLGARSYGRETGEDYDAKIGVERIRKWIGRLVDSSPASAEAVILDVGDFEHADDATNQTPKSKHPLDVDTRHFRTLEMSIAAMSYAIEYALRRHLRVTVRILPGNHNPTAYMAVMFAIAERYRSDPRVVVQKVPGEFWVHQFGRCFLAAHHGDKSKPERMVMFLADEYSQMWGQTRHRFLWSGHLHHMKAADIGGVQWEQLRAVTARDAHAVANAYVGRSQMQGITLHADRGEVLRVKVGD